MIKCSNYLIENGESDINSFSCMSQVIIVQNIDVSFLSVDNDPKDEKYYYIYINIIYLLLCKITV